MNPRTRLLIAIAAIALAAAILVVALARCGARPAPGMGMPQETVTPTPPDDSTAEPSVPIATFTPEPTPALTEAQLLARELIQPGGQVVYSKGGCDAVLETEPWCVVIDSATRITRPEWEELFPQTDFFLVKAQYWPQLGHGGQQGNWLIVERDGQRYTVETFDKLLEANGITTIPDEKRELVTKAFVLMTLGDYLEEEVVFSDWGPVDDGPRAVAELQFNYAITVWTKIQGLEIRWWFLFMEEDLRAARGWISEYGVGDYIDIPQEELPYPSLAETYLFWER